MGTKRTGTSQPNRAGHLPGNSLVLFKGLKGELGTLVICQCEQMMAELGSLQLLVVTSFGGFVVFSVPFVGLNKASVKSEVDAKASAHKAAMIYQMRVKEPSCTHPN